MSLFTKILGDPNEREVKKLQGAVEAIISHGSDEQKEYYLPKLISGEWTGTMNLAESQAGSDLGLVLSKAEPQGDGSYKISGQKIYITYGEHDLSENIIHLVLARTPNAPDDVKGISLFIVPKILEDGSRNAVSDWSISLVFTHRQHVQWSLMARQGI